MRDLALVVVITVAVAVAAHFGFQLERAGTRAFWVLAIAPTVAVALGACVYARAKGELARWMRPVWGDATRGVVGGALMFAGAYVVARGMNGTPRESWLARLYLQIGAPSTLHENMGIVAACVVVAAVSEELTWRGLVPELLEARVGTRWAQPVAACVYALAHVPTMWALRDPEAGRNPLLPCAALGMGLVLGTMTRAFRGRLLPAILAHALFDWVVVLPFRLWGPSG